MMRVVSFCKKVRLAHQRFALTADTLELCGEQLYIHVYKLSIKDGFMVIIPDEILMISPPR